jgi:hypothetical protein
MDVDHQNIDQAVFLQNGPPELMTRQELAVFLRLPEISKSDFDNIIDNLQRMRGLPTVHICRQPLYWLPAIREWLHNQVKKEQSL